MDSRVLETFVDQATALVRARPEAADCVLALAPVMLDLIDRAPAFLVPRYLRGEADHYARHLVHAAADGSLSLYVLVWSPGQWTPVHDHGTWGVVGVLEGVLEERSYVRMSCDREADEGIELARGGVVLLRQGAVTSFVPDPDHIHVTGVPAQRGRAISLHLYGRAMDSYNTYDVGSGTRRRVRLDYAWGCREPGPNDKEGRLVIDARELDGVPILAGVPHDDLARLARSAGDVHLAPGEYAVHEGDERSLFVVLDGQIEVTKAIDGIERVIGKRAPSQIFGEVPITFGTPYQGSYRATVPTRVMHIAAREFHALTAAHPDVLTRVATLASERIGGLRGLATAPPKARAIVLGQVGDGMGRELRNFLCRNQISHDWVAPDAPDRTARWSGPAIGDDELPAIACDDGAVLRAATCRDVARHLGLQTAPHVAVYDTLIVGGGPAGLAAAVYAASEGLRTVVIEREAPGGQAETSSRIENYLGFPTGVSGGELARRAHQQATRLGAEIVVTRRVIAIDPASKRVTLDGHEPVQARTIVLATGVAWRRLATDGFERLLGKGVHYGASRSEAAATQGQDIHLVGAGNSAGQAALFFANHARSVTLVVRAGSLEKSMSHYLVEQVRGKSNIRVALNCEVAAAHGDKALTAVDLRDRAAGTVQRADCGAVFVFIGADAETAWLPEAIARDERGYVCTGESVARSGRWRESRDPYLLETSVPGIFACGDVRSSPVKRVAAAVGEGSMAIAFVHQFLGRAE